MGSLTSDDTHGGFSCLGGVLVFDFLCISCWRNFPGVKTSARCAGYFHYVFLGGCIICRLRTFVIVGRVAA